MPARELKKNLELTARVHELETIIMPAYEQNIKLCDPAKNPLYHKQLADEYVALVQEYRTLVKR